MNSLSRDAFLAAAEEMRVSTPRAKDRDSLFLLAQMRLGDEAKVRDVRVRNLSEGGLMADVDAPVAVGTVATLDLRGIGEVCGRVAWFAEGRVGIALDTSIDPKKARKPVGRPAKAAPFAKSKA